MFLIPPQSKALYSYSVSLTRLQIYTNGISNAIYTSGSSNGTEIYNTSDSPMSVYVILSNSSGTWSEGSVCEFKLKSINSISGSVSYNILSASNTMLISNINNNLYFPRKGDVINYTITNPSSYSYETTYFEENSVTTDISQKTLNNPSGTSYTLRNILTDGCKVNYSGISINSIMDSTNKEYKISNQSYGYKVIMPNATGYDRITYSVSGSYTLSETELSSNGATIYVPAGCTVTFNAYDNAGNVTTKTTTLP